MKIILSIIFLLFIVGCSSTESIQPSSKIQQQHSSEAHSKLDKDFIK